MKQRCVPWSWALSTSSCKPSGSISLDIAIVGERLLDALRAASAANLAGLRMLPRAKVDRKLTPVHTSARATHAVVVASSTGGPRALAAIVPTLARGLQAAVLFVQHMPTGFTKSLAQRLDSMSPMAIAEAEDGEPIVHGRGYLAPGGRHMTVCQTESGPCIAIDDSPPVWGVRPAADHLFRTAASVFGGSTVAVVCVVLQPRPVLAGRDRAAQAAVPDDHPGVRDEGRQAADGVRRDGRRHAGPGARQMLVNLIDFGMNVQAAGDAARFHEAQSAGRVDLESNLFDLVGGKMRAMGYDVNKVHGNADQFGGYQAIFFAVAPGLKPPAEWVTKGDPPVNGVYRAASDFRKDGEAVGW